MLSELEIYEIILSNVDHSFIAKTNRGQYISGIIKQQTDREYLLTFNYVIINLPLIDFELPEFKIEEIESMYAGDMIIGWIRHSAVVAEDNFKYGWNVAYSSDINMLTDIIITNKDCVSLKAKKEIIVIF